MITQSQTLRPNIGIRSLLAVLRRSLTLVWRLSAPLVTMLLVLRIVSAFIPSLQVLVVKELTDVVAGLLASNGEMSEPVKWLAASGGLLLIGALLDAAAQYMTMLLKQKTQFTMETMLAEKSMSIPLSRFEQPQYYDQLQRAKMNVSFRGFQLIEQFFAIGQSLLTVASFFVVLWHFSWVLSLGMVLVVVPTLAVHMRIGEWKYWLMRVQTPFTRRLFYFFDLMTNRQSAKEVRLYRHASKLLQYWGGYFWRNAGEQKKVELRAQSLRMGIEGLNGTIAFLFSCYAVWVCYSQGLTLGAYVAIAQVLASTQSSMRMIAQNLSSIYEETLVMNEFYDFTDSGEEEDGQGRHVLNSPIAEGITVEHLTFAYPTSPKPVLKDLSFRIEPNQTVAIVGENGAGKSTLVNCLIGLYQEYSGTIRYDGVDLKELDANAFRDRTGAVFQDFLRYQVSAKENIGFGDVTRMEDMAAIEAAAAHSGAADVVRTLPDGMDTLLGPIFDGGHELSVGQWQKLALARSFMRDSAIMVLDEPTASMDPMAEAELFKRFAELAEGRITLLISHRLGSCRMADHILVLKNGELVEQGSHEQLIRLQGEYCRMYETQSQSYR
ncbi:ABC transporter ATP-binding protein [Paenibacillus harenae]|uniref:ATP-binding cassette subfamily B protein n=1 Tax=Paenibacillus harenae TaxID=306543 RepID=A0ABT9U773_PAEHA|nr:ABC transporter ATP-binding protein [Paenibacillus harenae]MDQ0115492.1 ATP-binding cassette subfamily B protein [Paenibacillus harenae]